jgi:hypothetical protein
VNADLKFGARLVIGLSVVSTLAACQVVDLFRDPPGKGSKAERGYRKSAPLIAALDRYRVIHGGYPETLEELVPDFLDSLPRESNKDGVILAYTRSASAKDYLISFSYVGPGMNSCTYSPAVRWKCSGYY